MKIWSARYLPFRPVWRVWLPGQRFSERWAGQKGIAEVLDSLPGHRPLVDLDPEELFAAEKASARQRWSR